MGEVSDSLEFSDPSRLFQSILGPNHRHFRYSSCYSNSSADSAVHYEPGSYEHCGRKRFQDSEKIGSQAEYPSTVIFPTVAICNNNHFRYVSLSFCDKILSVGRLSSVISKTFLHGAESEGFFDEVLLPFPSLSSSLSLLQALHRVSNYSASKQLTKWSHDARSMILRLHTCLQMFTERDLV